MHLQTIRKEEQENASLDLPHRSMCLLFVVLEIQRVLDAIGRIAAYDLGDSNEVKLISEDSDVSVGEHHEHALEVVAVLHLDMEQGQLVLQSKVYLNHSKGYLQFACFRESVFFVI